MFEKTRNLERSFQHIRLFFIAWMVVSCALNLYVLSKSFSMLSAAERKIYILSSGKVLEAFAGDRKENLPVEARDHIRSFHEDFFTLDPDEKVINSNLSRALDLADGSAKRLYNNLRETGYYAEIITGNISQRIKVDSIALELGSYPYHFKCQATQTIIRFSSIVTRNLVTEGWLRNTDRSDNNPHGFLIERWNTLDNKDLKVEAR